MNKTSAIIRIIIYSVIALVLSALLVWGIIGGWSGSLVNGLADMINTKAFSSEDDSDYTVYDGKTLVFDADKVDSVDIEWISGSVNVEKGDGKSISVRETSKSELSENQTMRYKTDGKTLKIKYCKSTVSFKFFDNTPEKNLTVILPEKLYKEISVETVSAETKVSHISANDFNLDSASGTIDLIGLTGKSIDVENVSGDFSATVCKTDLLDCEGVSGEMIFSGTINESVSTDNVSGAVTIESSVCPAEGDFNTVSGNLRLSVPKDSGFTATFSTASGSFNCDFNSHEDGDEHICGSGESDFSFDTVSGNVHITECK